jgi:hypothetical protein
MPNIPDERLQTVEAQPPPLPPPIPPRPATPPLGPNASLRAQRPSSPIGKRLILGAAAGFLAGVLAGVAMLVAIASLSRGRGPTAAAEIALVVQLGAWLLILLAASLIALGPRALAASVGPILFGLFILGRALANELAATKGNPAAGVTAPGIGTVFAASLVGAVAGGIFVWRLSRRRPPQTAAPIPSTQPNWKGHVE